MKLRYLLLLPALATLLPLTAMADHDDDHHGRRGEYKEEYWDGACKVKRKYKHNGEYKEERKCKDEPQPVYMAPQPAYVAPQPVYVPAPAPAPRPGVTIQGTFRLP